MATEKPVEINGLEHWVHGNKLVPSHPKRGAIIVKSGSKISLSKPNKNLAGTESVYYVEQSPPVKYQIDSEGERFKTPSFLNSHARILLTKSGQIHFLPKNLPQLILLARKEFGFKRDRSFNKDLWYAVIQGSK